MASSSSSPALNAFFDRIANATSAALDQASSGVGFSVGEPGYASSQQLARCFAISEQEAGALAQSIAMVRRSSSSLLFTMYLYDADLLTLTDDI